jgi:hypothetical protein
MIEHLNEVAAVDSRAIGDLLLRGVGQLVDAYEHHVLPKRESLATQSLLDRVPAVAMEQAEDVGGPAHDSGGSDGGGLDGSHRT